MALGNVSVSQAAIGGSVTVVPAAENVSGAIVFVSLPFHPVRPSIAYGNALNILICSTERGQEKQPSEQ